MMRLGIDLGGTAIKSGLVSDTGEILFPETTPTNTQGGEQAVLDTLTDVCRRQLERESVSAIGIGAPGQIDSQNGVLVCAANLPLQNTPVSRVLGERLGVPVFLENDANCALYGETFAGAGKHADNFLLVTVGTGVGGGIRIGGGIYQGVDGRAGEFGHMTVDPNGLPCPCGRTGCWERYASTSALCRMTEKAAKAFPESILAQQIAESRGVIDGRTVFRALRSGCPAAGTALDDFSRWLAIGLDSLTTIFRPEQIVLAGAIFREGELLLSRIRRFCREPERLSVSTLDGKAGLIGASLLPERNDPSSPISHLLRRIG